jgi:hypothetical protein
MCDKITDEIPPVMRGSALVVALVLGLIFCTPVTAHAHGIPGWMIAIFMLPFVLIAAGLAGLAKRGLLRLILGPGARASTGTIVGIGILEVIVIQAPWILEPYVRKIDAIKHSFDTILGALVFTAVVNVLITLVPHLLLMRQASAEPVRQVPWVLKVPVALVFGVLTPVIFFGALHLWKG